MQSNAIHRILALTLAFLMIFSSVGFSIDVHYCKDELKTISFFGEAPSCHTAKKVCPHHSNMVVDDEKEKNCCNNKTIEIDELDEDYTINGDVSFTNLELDFITAYVFVFAHDIIQINERSSFLIEDNPLPPRAIYVLLERYLI